MGLHWKVAPANSKISRVALLSPVFPVPLWQLLIQNLSAVISLAQLMEQPVSLQSVNLAAPSHLIHKYFIMPDTPFELWPARRSTEATHLASQAPHTWRVPCFIVTAERLRGDCGSSASKANSEADTAKPPWLNYQIKCPLVMKRVFPWNQSWPQKTWMSCASRPDQQRAATTTQHKVGGVAVLQTVVVTYFYSVKTVYEV